MNDFYSHLAAIRQRLRADIERLTAYRAEMQERMPPLPRDLPHARNVLFLLRAQLITAREQLRFQQVKCRELQLQGEALLQHLSFASQHQQLYGLLSECYSVLQLALAAGKTQLNSA